MKPQQDSAEIPKYLLHSYTLSKRIFKPQNLPATNDVVAIKVEVARGVRDLNSQHQIKHVSLFTSALLLSPLEQNRNESSCRVKIKTKKTSNWATGLSGRGSQKDTSSEGM